jgi:hypothetical protein
MADNHPHDQPDPRAPFRHPELQPRPQTPPPPVAPYAPDPDLDRLDSFKAARRSFQFWCWSYRINLHQMTPDAALPLVPDHLQEYRLKAMRGEV